MSLLPSLWFNGSSFKWFYFSHLLGQTHKTAFSCTSLFTFQLLHSLHSFFYNNLWAWDVVSYTIWEEASHHSVWLLRFNSVDNDIKILIGIVLNLYIAFGGISIFNMNYPGCWVGGGFLSFNVWLSSLRLSWKRIYHLFLVFITVIKHNENCNI